MPKPKTRAKFTLFSNLDRRIYSVFFVTLLLATALLFIQKKDYVDCQNSEFNIDGEKFTTGEVIAFSNNTPNAKKWQWDFGDGSPIETREKVLHQFEQPGTYEINLLINGSCVVSQKIEISYQERLVNTSKVPQIIMPPFAEIGEAVNFAFDYPGEVQSAEWSFGETSQLDGTGDTPNYTYKTEGEKTVALIINGDINNMARAKILVKPKTKIESTGSRYTPPPITKNEPFITEVPTQRAKDVEVTPPKPVGVPDPIELPAKTPDPEPKKEVRGAEISKEKFMALLIGVSNNTVSATNFNEFFCGNDKVRVVSDGKVYDFNSFCSRIRNKEIRIKSLSINKDENNCIQSMNVNYEVKKIIGWGKDND